MTIKQNSPNNLIPVELSLAVLVLISSIHVISVLAEREAQDDYYYNDDEPGPPPTLPPDFNICDLKGSYPIYCYCNYINPNEVGK